MFGYKGKAVQKILSGRTFHWHLNLYSDFDHNNVTFNTAIQSLQKTLQLMMINDMNTHCDADLHDTPANNDVTSHQVWS